MINLSVIIPVFNAEAFIDKSYRSILDQNISDFEIIYVNNNSEDKSVELIQKLIHKDSRVKLLHQPLQGAAPARNLGIKNAKGEYIYVFDVDDELYPEALNSMVKVLDENTEIDAVFGKMVKSNKPLIDSPKPAEETLQVEIKQKPFWGLLWFKDLSKVVGPPAFLYKKETLVSLGYYNEALKNNEDTALDIKLGMTKNIAFLDKYVYLYFKHSESTIEQSKRKTPRTFMIWPRLIKEHLPFYLEHQDEHEFGDVLKQKLMANIGRQLLFTKGYNNRNKLFKKLKKDIYPFSISPFVNFYLSIFVMLPSSVGLKFYTYYIVPYTVKQMK